MQGEQFRRQEARPGSYFEGGAGVAGLDIPVMGPAPPTQNFDPSASQDGSDYRAHERSVMHLLCVRFPTLDGDERREIYQEIWASVLHRRAEGAEIDNVGAYLHAAAHKLAAKRAFGADARRRVTFDPADPAWAGLVDTDELPEERAVAADEARRLRMLVGELDSAEQAVLKLRIDGGLEPAEVRQRLGMTDRQYRRAAQRAGAALREQFDAFDRGRWAKSKRSLLLTVMMGIASPRQRKDAAALVAEDPACRAMMTELRRAADHAVAVLPWPAAAATTSTAHGLPARLAEASMDLKQRALDTAHSLPHPGGGHGRLVAGFGEARRRGVELVVASRQHATGLVARAGDPTPAAGLRPGALGAVVAGCVAVGGGATYCASQGLAPVRDLAGINHASTPSTPAPPKPSSKEPASQSPPPPQLPASAPTQTTTAPPAQQQSQPTSPAPVTPTATTPQPAPAEASSAQEFDPGGGSAPSVKSPTSHSSPAPPSSGEFSGP